MIEFSTEKIKEAYDKSNPIIKQIVLDSWVTEDVSLIGKKYSLRVDKIDILVKLVGYVVLNLLPISKLIKAISDEIGLEQNQSSEIAKKIDEIIFTKIREKLKQENENQVEIKEATQAGLINNIKPSTDFSKEVNSETFSESLQSNNEINKKRVDPYREPIE